MSGDYVEGGEYRIQINGYGNAQKYVQAVTTDVQRANQAVNQFGEGARKSSSKLTDSLKSTSSYLQPIRPALDGLGQNRGPKQVQNGLKDIEVAAQNALSSIDAVSYKLVGLFTAGVRAAAGVEESNARLAFGLTKIGIAYDAVLDKVDEVSLKTAMTRKEITDLVSGMAMAKINVFDKGLDSLTSVVNGKEVKISGAEVIGDAAAKVFGGAERVRRSLTEAVSEGKVKFGKWLAEDLDLTKDRVNEYNKAIKAAKTPQEKFNALIREMNKDVGGAALALGGTLSFALKQVDDWIEKIAFESFKDSLPTFRQAVIEAGEAILTFAKGPEIKVIGSAFANVARVVATVGGFMLKAALATAKFIGQRPALANLAAIIGGVAVAVGFVLSGFLAAAAMVAAFKAALGAVPFVLTAIKTGLLALAPLVAKIAIIGLLATVFARAVVGGKTFSETWERVGKVISGVSEGIRAMSGDTTRLSMKTAQALQEAGLLDLVWTILEYAHAAKKFFEEARAVVVPFGETVWNATEAIVTFTADHFTMVKAIIVGWGVFKGFQLALKAWAGAVALYNFALVAVPAALLAIKGAMIALRGVILANPLVAAAVGIATAAYLIYQYWDPISEFFSNLWSGITATFESAMAWVLDKIDWAARKIQGFIDYFNQEELGKQTAEAEATTEKLRANSSLFSDDDEFSVHGRVLTKPMTAAPAGAFSARAMNYIGGAAEQLGAGVSSVIDAGNLSGPPLPDPEAIGRASGRHLARELRRSPLQANLDTKRVSDAVGSHRAREAETAY